jgi:hypothetical protein
MISIKVKNLDYISFISSNRIQNNQRKDNLKIFNQQINNYSKIVIVSHLNNLNQIHKRFMFTKGSGSLVLKKSGEIVTNIEIKSDFILKSPLSSPRGTGLIMSSKNVTISQINNFAHVNKINTKLAYYLQDGDCKYYHFNLKERCLYLSGMCRNLNAYGEFTKEHMLNYTNFLATIQRGVTQHTVVTEIINQTNESITFGYYIITTKPKEVNFGGINKFKPLYLCKDLIAGKSFYTIPVMFIDTLPKEDFDNIFEYKDLSKFKDGYDRRRNFVDSIRELERNKEIEFKEIHIKNDFFDKKIADIDFNTLFKNKSDSNILKGLNDSTFLYNN